MAITTADCGPGFFPATEVTQRPVLSYFDARIKPTPSQSNVAQSALVLKIQPKCALLVEALAKLC